MQQALHPRHLRPLQFPLQTGDFTTLPVQFTDQGQYAEEGAGSKKNQQHHDQRHLP